MSTLTSNDLEVIQTTFKRSIRRELKRPDCDYEELASLVNLTGKIDNVRRATWHKEKFGVYEEMAEEFNIDDIPF